MIRPLRVLWTTPGLLPDAARALNLAPKSTASWLVALAAAIASERSQIELATIGTHHGIEPARHSVDGILHYVVPCNRNGERREPTGQLRRRFAEALADFRPDVVHVNGSEYNLGLIITDIAPAIPTVLSIQGLIGPCAKVYCGGMSLRDQIRYRTVRDWLSFDGIIERHWEFRRRAKMELRTLKRIRHFIGRTDWDRAYTRAANPAARYYHCEELLRPEFYKKSWRAESTIPQSIFTVAQGLPLKGLHVLFEAVSLLKHDYPHIQVRIPGISVGPDITWSGRLRRSGYRKYLFERIRQLALGDHVRSLGPLTATEVANELARAHVFVLPSFIENSSNSLAEAMLVGTPCVASFAGGTPSILHDRVEGLCFPAGDSVVLAEHLRTLFDDMSMCRSLSESASRNACERHAPRRIVDNLLSIYHDVVGQS